MVRIYCVYYYSGAFINLITSRRNILADAWQHIDVTSDKFKEIQKRIESSISSVNPHEEYREFTEKNKYVRWPDLVFSPVRFVCLPVRGRRLSITLLTD